MRCLSLKLSNSAAVVFVSTLLLASAEDWTTKSGKIFKNVQATAMSAGAITIKHNAGTDTVPLADLPPDIQKRYSAEELFRQLQDKTRELERLNGELGTAKEQVAKAKQAEPRRGRAAAPPLVPAPGLLERPTPPIKDLPSLQPTEVVQVADLFEHYRNDPAGADRRYKGKVFQIQGAVERFGPTPFLRKYAVALETPERSRKVECRFSYADELKSVITRDDGQQLVANLVTGGANKLM